MKKLQVLGPGCRRCQQLADNTESAALDLGIAFELEKITDLNEILNLGVVSTPALLVDGEIKVMGEVPAPDDITPLIA